MSPAEQHVEVAIVGTGFSGLGMAIQLKKAGRNDFVILEKAHDVGGTWRENHYPGCACDVPSHLYSFSFEPNPNWTRRFAPQAEILEYLRGCADKYGVRSHIRFGCEVQRAEFDEDAQLWRLFTSDGVVRARHVVFGVGALSKPLVPKLRGMERFRGRAFHSAQWDHGFELYGKRVAVVGTGASAIQFVPRIVEQVAQLHLFQRTAPWVLPHPDRPIGAFARWLFRTVPALQRLARWAIYGHHEARALGFTVAPWIMKAARWLGERNIRAQIPNDAALRAQVRPTYLPGCKRVLMSNTYYRALARPNAEVVTGEIAEVTETGIVDASGVERPVDAIIFGTGFDVQHLLTPMRIYGRGGVELNALWQNGGVEAYRGTAIAGFPNLHTLMGPNTGLGHTSMVFMIEAQIGYVLRYMQALDAHGVKCADVRPEAQRAFNDELQQRLARTVWASGCRSWYLDDKGRNAALWPGFTFEFWWRNRHLDPTAYDFEPAATSRAA